MNLRKRQVRARRKAKKNRIERMHRAGKIR
jgi:hypothetical protein